jgi:hypothetical protein
MENVIFDVMQHNALTAFTVCIYLCLLLNSIALHGDTERSMHCFVLFYLNRLLNADTILMKELYGVLFPVHMAAKAVLSTDGIFA